MTKKELIKSLENIPDDFEIKLLSQTDNTVKASYETYKIRELSDIGYSNKTVIFEIEED